MTIRRSGHRPALLALGVALLVMACSDSTTPSTSTGGGPEERPTDAVDVVREQVEATLTGDIDAANALRCDGFRFDTAADIERDVAAVQDTSGPLVLDDVRDLPWSEPSDRRIEYSVTSASGSTTTWRVLVASDRGAGCVSDLWLGAHESVARDVVDAMALVQPGSEEYALPAPIEAELPGYTSAAVEAWSPDLDGVSDGWTVAWQADGFGGARVSTAVFESATWAQVAATELLQRAMQFATTQIHGLPDGAVGYRYLAYGYLGVQPDDSGPVIDQVVLQRGNVVSAVQVSGLQPSDPFDLVVDLAGRSAGTIGH